MSASERKKLKKLLVLDLNGLLLDKYFGPDMKWPSTATADRIIVNKTYMYKRPFCDEFLGFCLENFKVGIWSTAQKHNTDGFVHEILGKRKSKLAFCWNQMQNTNTPYRHPFNPNKEVFLKELKQLWDGTYPQLPWRADIYGPHNTLLVEHSAYKAVKNPVELITGVALWYAASNLHPHTAIFVPAYKAGNKSDAYLVGELQPYLEEIRDCDNVQDFVKANPFGEPNISLEKESPWHFLKNEAYNEHTTKRASNARNGGSKLSNTRRSSDHDDSLAAALDRLEKFNITFT